MVEKKSKNLVTGLPLQTLFILSVSAISSLSPEMGSVVIYDRNGVIQGEVWRLLSSHFVHFTPSHLTCNLLIFGAAGWIVEKKSGLGFSLLYIWMALFIGLALFTLSPAMGYYGGLSGMACGFAFYAALTKIKEPGPWKAICQCILLCLLAKTLTDLFHPPSVLSLWEQQPFVKSSISHAAGITAACIFYVIASQQGRHLI